MSNNNAPFCGQFLQLRFWLHMVLTHVNVLLFCVHGSVADAVVATSQSSEIVNLDPTLKIKPDPELDQGQMRIRPERYP